MFSHRFNDIFVLKWLISIISIHVVIEKVEFNGAQLYYDINIFTCTIKLICSLKVHVGGWEGKLRYHQ